jgi:hypothetical protein
MSESIRGLNTQENYGNLSAVMFNGVSNLTAPK